jgi:hypothetical protein
VRRLLTKRSETIAELQANYVSLCETNRQMLEAADKQNQALASSVCELEKTLRFASAEDVPLTGDLRFGCVFSKYVKKAAIGSAVRMIQLMQHSINMMKKFVNWVGAA